MRDTQHGGDTASRSRPSRLAPLVLLVWCAPAAASGADAGVSGATAYAYDNNGNMTSRGDGTHTDTFTYDHENRLVAAEIQTGAQPAGALAYGYHADGLRTSKTAGGTTTHYLVDKNRDHAQVLAERAAAAGTVSYSHGIDLITMTREGSKSYYHFDGHASARNLSDAGGQASTDYQYDAFGGVLGATGAVPNDFLYNAQQFDPELGQYYLRARYYSPTTGRFATGDPFPGICGAPTTLHRYLYVGADPVNSSDPSGLFSLPDVMLSVALAGSIGAVGISQYLVSARPSGVRLIGGEANIAESQKLIGLQLAARWLEQGGANYETWFDAAPGGAISDTRREDVFNTMRKLIDKLDGASFYYGESSAGGSCGNPSVLAYTSDPYPNSIFLCAFYFRLKLGATCEQDTQASTLMHEAAHLAGAEDVLPGAYNVETNKKWATSDPGKAIRNANNYEKAVNCQ